MDPAQIAADPRVRALIGAVARRYRPPVGLDRDDLAQDAYTWIIGHLADFDPRRGTLPGWIAAHAQWAMADAIDRMTPPRNVCVDSLDQPASQHPDAPALIDTLPTPDPGPDVIAEHHWLYDQAIRLLDGTEGAAVRLRAHGWTTVEIADFLDLSRSTVQGYISRGTRRLRDQLTPAG